MIFRMFIFFILTFFASSSFAQSDLLINTYNRSAMNLNGDWHYIVDPYENGYYNYRYEPFDRMENPGDGAFFMNAKADDKTDLVEYNFDNPPHCRSPATGIPKINNCITMKDRSGIKSPSTIRRLIRVTGYLSILELSITRLKFT